MMDQIFVGSFIPSDGAALKPAKMANIWTSPSRAHWWGSSMFGSRSDSGIDVTSESALTHTPLWHGLTLLGGDAGALPLELKRKEGEEMVDVTDHDAYLLAAKRPNPLMCPSNFWESMVVIAILHGNALAEVPRTNSGRPLSPLRGGALDILPPHTTKPWFDESGKLWIESWITHPNMTIERKLTDPDDTVHIPSLSMDGFWGRGIIHVGANRIGYGLGMEKQGNRFMKNGMQPSWLFSYPIHLDPEERISVEEQLTRRNVGLDNTGRNLVLDEGVKAQQLGLTFEHAQFVELMKMDVQMVSSLLGIPAVMLNAMDKMTFNNTEEAERWYINRTLRRWLNKIHQELAAKLLTDVEQASMEFKHDLAPLLKGRLKERMEAYAQGITARIYSPNEVREMEGMNPYEGGDVYENPNTLSADQQQGDSDDNQGAGSEQDRSRLAGQLRSLMQLEDHELETACRDEGDLATWMTEFYRIRFLNQMSSLAPKSANDYCEGRLKMFVNFGNHVVSTRQLGELVKCQKRTVPDRVAGILNAEFLHEN